MPAGQRASIGAGILGFVALVGILVLIFFIGFIVLGIVAIVVVVGLLVWAVDRVLLALSPRRRERRAQQQRAFVWQFGQFSQQPSEDVIDTTAIDSPRTVREPRSRPPDELKPE